MKKVIILRAAGNELANQLWNYAGIYAYILERGYTVENPSFFEYAEYFSMRPATSSLFRFFFCLPFRNYWKRKTALKRRIWRKFYTWYATVREVWHENRIIRSGLERAYRLPPSAPATHELGVLEAIGQEIYFDGWLFRNPVGLEKYRERIRDYFAPRSDIDQNVHETVTALRSQYRTVIGVHIRQGDYRDWRGGAYFLPQTRVREILNEYLKERRLESSHSCFLITSDGPIDTDVFSGLNIHVNHGDVVEDLFLLSSTEAVLGSNSTFGAFASYLGNIPFIVMQEDSMEWEYYRGMNQYFENKYATFVRY